MPTLLCRGPGHTTGVPLDTNAFWRLTIGPTLMGQTPALALVLRYPPGDEHSQVALLRVPVTVANEIGEVVQVAGVALSGGDQATDKQRLTEAFNLFKNSNRAPSEARLNEDVESASKLIDAYWAVQGWVMGGFDGQFEHVLNNQVLKGLP